MQAERDSRRATVPGICLSLQGRDDIMTGTLRETEDRSCLHPGSCFLAGTMIHSSEFQDSKAEMQTENAGIRSIRAQRHKNTIHNSSPAASPDL
jgi:hypothetical protein